MDYSSSGEFRNLDLIDSLGSTMLMTSQLTFLGLSQKKLSQFFVRILSNLHQLW